MLIEQQTASLREELEAMTAQCQLHYDFAQKKVLELEAVKKAHATEVRLLRQDVFSGVKQVADLHTQLEATKKEREEAKQGRWVNEGGLLIIPYLEYKRTIDQRDEAVKLLREWLIYSVPDESDRGQSIEEDTEDFLSRQSSGETKPPEIPDSSPISQKITFHLLDNENPPYPEENVLWWYKGPGCPPYSGSMLDEEFPGLGYFVAWCNIPTPPESLTDKNQTNAL